MYHDKLDMKKISCKYFRKEVILLVVEVAGKVTACDVLEKDGKVSTRVLLLQPGYIQQVEVRISGRYECDLFEDLKVRGRLISWKKRDGSIGHVVFVDEL